MAYEALQTGVWPVEHARPARWRRAVEDWLERERDQLPLWVPVALGLGIAAWFALPGRSGWSAALCGFGAAVLAGVALDVRARTGRAVLLIGLLGAGGLLLAWARADRVGAPVLERAGLHRFDGVVERVQPMPADKRVRVLLATDAASGVPPRVRVTIPEAAVPGGLGAGDRLRVRAWLMPPAPPAVPGAYDFARAAWFQGIGATGRALPPVERIAAAGQAGADLRGRLNAHIRDRLPGAAGGIASALATGDQAAIPEPDAEAMRRSGLAHLLSISGLHVTAVVGATMLIVLRLLALWPLLALRLPLLLIAAGAGALVGIGYTLLSGAEVPTVRSCIAALLVLGGIALGREAITLRLVGAGALVVLLLWPESLVGASFQMSFAAVTAIVALHAHPRIAALLSRRGESGARRLGRGLLSLLLTGIAVEIVLMPIAIYHFHKAGLYGAFANIVAIPLTTFVTMPLEALALLLDPVGLSAPFWWATARSLDLLLWIAHAVAGAPGSVAAVPGMSMTALGLAVGGGLWLLLWQHRPRWLGMPPFLLGLGLALTAPAPDLVVTGDGRHLMLRGDDGAAGLLRDRSGDYVRDMLGAATGADGEAPPLAELPGARCGPDACVADVDRGGRRWTIFATRSPALLDWPAMVRACRRADIVVSDRRLPPQCAPRWLKLDRPALARTGGVAVDLERGTVRAVREAGDAHPWAR